MGNESRDARSTVAHSEARKSTIRAQSESVDSYALRSASHEGGKSGMRRLLIALTLVLLVAVSVGVGVLVAGWPRWQEAWF
jgi:hypothetical protein